VIDSVSTRSIACVGFTISNFLNSSSAFALHTAIVARLSNGARVRSITGIEIEGIERLDLVVG
jgi:hypothetical protein